MDSRTVLVGSTFYDFEGHKCTVLQVESENSRKAYTVLVRWHATSWLIDTGANGCMRYRFNRKRDAMEYFNMHPEEFCYNAKEV